MTAEVINAASFALIALGVTIGMFEIAGAVAHRMTARLRNGSHR